MAKRNSWFTLIAGGMLGAAASAGYVYYLRPKMLRWGATDDEVIRYLPGDDLVIRPKIVSTHAITIDTRPYRVWPWLVQMGQGRGGFYTYDWLENLFGLDIHSADRILVTYQDLHEGDFMPLAPGGFGLRVAQLEENRALVLHGDTRSGTSDEMPTLRPGDFLAATWSFYLIEAPAGSTRLVERFRADWNPSLINTLFYRLILEPGQSFMQRGMLEGIKERAVGRRVWKIGETEYPIDDSSSGLETGTSPDLRPSED